MQINILVLLPLLFFFATHKVHAQDMPENGVFVQSGLSYAENKVVDGIGIQWGVGYQQAIWKDRLRWVPSFIIGKYNSKVIDDAPDAYFNSLSLKNNVNLDVFKIKAFSLLVGTGLTLNYSSGLSGPAVDHIQIEASGGYFNNFNLAVNASMGFRFQPMGRKISYEFYIFDASVPNGNSFAEFAIAQFRLVINLNSH